MAAASSRRSNGLARSSPTGRRYPSQSSSASNFSSKSPRPFQRSSSPTRVNIVGFAPPTSSVRFSIDRPASPGRSLAFATPREHHLSLRRPIPAAPAGGGRKTCMCAPTNHPGSFRCRLHKGFGARQHHHAESSPSNRLNMRRSAMTNSLVRIGTVEGEWVRRSLAALIRPSSLQQRRRAFFHHRPSRLSVMSDADDL